MNSCFLLLVALICFATQTNAQEGPQSLQRVIPVEDCSDISVDTPSGWWLLIQPDGSARLGYGSTGGDDVRLPAGSFSFSEVHRKLSALEFNGVGLSRDSSVAFRKRDATTAYGLSTSGHQAIKELFQMARDRVKDFDHQGRLASIWAGHLPIP